MGSAHTYMQRRRRESARELSGKNKQLGEGRAKPEKKKGSRRGSTREAEGKIQDELKARIRQEQREGAREGTYLALPVGMSSDAQVGAEDELIISRRGSMMKPLSNRNG